MTGTAVSKINNMDAPPEVFYFGRPSDFAIGFDGLGAIDMDRSDLEQNVVCDKPALIEAVVRGSDRPPNIYMRRAVREFDLLYAYKTNSLLVRGEFFGKYQHLIENSTDHRTQVTCHFASHARAYLYGNLRYRHCLKSTIIWTQSTFKIVNSSEFDINVTKIERGERLFDYDVTYKSDGVRFESEPEYNAAYKVLTERLPVTIALRIERCDIINLGIGQTLFSHRLVEELRSAKRPKSRIAGTAFSYPKVEVTFVNE